MDISKNLCDGGHQSFLNKGAVSDTLLKNIFVADLLGS